MKTIARISAFAALAVAGAFLSVPASAQSQNQRAYNWEETAAAARDNYENGRATPSNSDWRASVQQDASSSTQPERGYGF